MKRTFTLFTILALVVIVTSCGKKASTTIVENGTETSQITDESSQTPEAKVFGELPPGAYDKFTVKDGTVYEGDMSLYCDLNDITVEGPAQYWAVLGPDTSEDIAKEETGLWMFTSAGEVCFFVPLEDDKGIQNIIFSPGQNRFVIEEGSGIRPDLFFMVYGPEGKIAEFPGLRHSVSWVSPSVFVFTKIEDGDREGSFLNLGYGLYLSAVKYDAEAKKETPLREATVTQNFYLSDVAADKKSVTIGVESVEYEKDWASPEKIEHTELKVMIP